MWRQAKVAAFWVLTIAAGIVLAERWRPWSTIIGIVTFLVWMAIIAAFVHSNRAWRPALRRKRDSDRDPN